VKDVRQHAGFDMDYNSEYYLIRRLNHRGCQNVIQVYDQGYYLKAAGGQSFFRMALEWCNLGDLSALKKWYTANQYVISIVEGFELTAEIIDLLCPKLSSGMLLYPQRRLCCTATTVEFKRKRQATGSLLCTWISKN
jgi:hypothetical protein